MIDLSNSTYYYVHLTSDTEPFGSRMRLVLPEGHDFSEYTEMRDHIGVTMALNSLEIEETGGRDPLCKDRRIMTDALDCINSRDCVPGFSGDIQFWNIGGKGSTLTYEFKTDAFHEVYFCVTPREDLTWDEVNDIDAIVQLGLSIMAETAEETEDQDDLLHALCNLAFNGAEMLNEDGLIKDAEFAIFGEDSKGCFECIIDCLE